MAVNISAIQFRDPGLAGRIRNILAESGLAPEYLELEITESVAMLSGGDTEARLQELRALGVRLSLDDFGTGYSSLQYLICFPVHVLKIDRSFVRLVPDSQHDSELARAIIMLASGIHLETVAEGVESKEQWEFLRRNGCDNGQGYLFSRPLPADELFAFCKER